MQVLQLFRCGKCLRMTNHLIIMQSLTRINFIWGLIKSRRILQLFLVNHLLAWFLCRLPLLLSFCFHLQVSLVKFKWHHHNVWGSESNRLELLKLGSQMLRGLSFKTHLTTLHIFNAFFDQIATSYFMIFCLNACLFVICTFYQVTD